MNKLPLLLLALFLASLAQAAEGHKKRPRRGADFTPPAGVVWEKDVAYGKAGGHDLLLDLLRPETIPETPMPAVVWFHGGGFRAGNKERDLPRLVPLVQAGFVCASVEYRLTGEACFPAQIEDAKCAVRFLRAKAKEYAIDPDHIGTWGFSAGGGLSAQVGTSGDLNELEGTGGWQDQSSRVQAACCWAGLFDYTTMGEAALGHEEVLEAFLGGKLEDRMDVAKRASPLTHVTKDDPPFLVVRGGKDPKIPESQALGFVEALKKAGVDVTYHLLPEAGHGGPGFEKEGAEALAFFQKHLKPAAKP
jgi:acetyl esterase/lipase